MATTPVPPPVSGNINETVPSVSAVTKAPVPLNSPASFDDGVGVAIASVKAVDAKGQGLPGEVAGPALAVTVTLTNSTKSAITPNDVVVNLQDSSGTPGAPISGSPGVPFSGTLAPGATATAVYVFTIPTAHRNPVTINLSYAKSTTVVLFAGTAQ